MFLLLAVTAVCAAVCALGAGWALVLVARRARTRLVRLLKWSGLNGLLPVRRVPVKAIAWVVAIAYVAAMLIGFAIEQRGSDGTRFRNTTALAALPPVKQRVRIDNWLANELVARLQSSDTLVLLALSGGGSRAAYFDAAVLEQLALVNVPGRTGRPVPLTQRIDAISTVSGGSMAGAYFVTHRPAREEASDAELGAFFAAFKNAMAADFERKMAAQHLWPWRSLELLAGRRTLAGTLADVLDDELFASGNLRFDSIRARERAGGPLLVVNATETSRFGLLAFVPGDFYARLYAPTERPGESGLSLPRLSTVCNVEWAACMNKASAAKHGLFLSGNADSTEGSRI